MDPENYQTANRCTNPYAVSKITVIPLLENNFSLDDACNSQSGPEMVGRQTVNTEHGLMKTQLKSELEFE
jgi:hypothetical protein